MRVISICPLPAGSGAHRWPYPRPPVIPCGIWMHQGEAPLIEAENEWLLHQLPYLLVIELGRGETQRGQRRPDRPSEIGMRRAQNLERPHLWLPERIDDKLRQYLTL